MFVRIKRAWDPKGILNPGKIVDALPIDQDLRIDPSTPVGNYKTKSDFSEQGGILAAVEKCNGSGDCRKLDISGGGMCPSYRATHNEKDSTRARANALREMLRDGKRKNSFNRQELKEVMDLCISCKACTNECPSNVDMSLLKAESYHQFYKSNKVPLRERLVAKTAQLNKMAIRFSSLSNLLLGSRTVKRKLGFSLKRNLPRLNKTSLRKAVKEEAIQSNKASG